MTRRLLVLLLLVLLVPASAQATTIHFRSAHPSASSGGVLHKARAALANGGDVLRGADVTPLLKQLALALPHLSGSARKQAVDLLQRPTQGEGGSNELEYEVP